MKTGFFLKLARSNISKNRRFFLPRILSEAGLLCVFYIVFTLRADERILQLRGGQYIEVFMSIGVAVMMLLSVILLFYINSFLMKQRKREFGVYNILGLEKRHICRVLFHETALSSLASVVLGLAMGTLFYKLCSLLICQLLNAEIVLGFYFINARSLALSGAFFLVLDVMAYGVNCVTIARLKPVELLSSANVGEREPKVKWPLLVLGLLALGGGYYISLTTQNPLKALVLFFVAVILVIIGTYFLFVAGSIFVLKALKKNKRFYYNKKHMPAVSGLLYRMKQNAVGLASIAILATGVLVMISTTVCLFATVLIVYYKQISEGYEDRVRFQIMQKVGMSRREVKSTINSQVLLVFFLPLVVAGMHLAFAFPILEKVLHILLLSSTSLFVVCSLVTFGVFAAVYTLIYMATARTYYKIVR